MFDELITKTLGDLGALKRLLKNKDLDVRLLAQTFLAISSLETLLREIKALDENCNNDAQQ